MTGYERRIGRYSRPLAAEMVKLASVTRGRRVLDVACGTGPPAEALAKIVGEENVAAIDSSADDIAACRSRVPRADVRIGTADALPYADAEFDGVLAQLLVHLVDDAESVAREMRRVARPDAPVITCDQHDQSGYRYATEHELESLWREAGCRDTSTGALVAASDYESFDDYWEPLLVPDGAPGRFLATLSPELQEAIRDELWRRIGRPSGSFRLDARAWYVLGLA